MGTQGRRIVEHEGHRLLVEEGQGENSEPLCKYSLFKYVNGERFGISNLYNIDSQLNRDTFLTEALKGFERARAAPFN